MKTIDELKAALHKMHARAMGDTSQVYMSIPADRNRDADLMLMDALDELADWRAREQIQVDNLRRYNASLPSAQVAP